MHLFVTLTLGAAFTTLPVLVSGAAVASASTGGSIPIVRRPNVRRDYEEWGLWAKHQKRALEARYGSRSISPAEARKRGSGYNLLTNQNADSSYYGTVAVGTPSVSYNVILDTGSADLWLAADGGNVPSSISMFEPNASSTFTALDSDFSIKYGSGSAQGILGRDVIQFCGFEVQDQVFGVVTNVTDNLLNRPASGLFGLGFQSIASSGFPPLWETLVGTEGVLDEPLMAFHLTRFVNDSTVRSVEPGGTFTLGAVNSSLYQGEIHYQDIPSGAVGYWIQNLASITVQGISLGVTDTYAAIDTGTTLIGGPEDAIAEFYSHIPGSAPGTGNYEGYYTFPCSTEVDVSLAFGSNGIPWSISPSDFKLAELSPDSCMGAFFVFNSPNANNAPKWVVGDAFLKNVYSVFRAEPPSVGFAQLSEVALAQNGANSLPPTPTLGTPSATATAASSDSTTTKSLPHLTCISFAAMLAAGMVMSRWMV